MWPQWIEELSSAPTYFDPAGFRYYLPALMTWSLTRGLNSGSATPDNLLWLLGDPGRQERLAQALTPRQLHVVAQFVEFMLDNYWASHDDQTRSLAAFWRAHR